MREPFRENHLIILVSHLNALFSCKGDPTHCSGFFFLLVVAIIGLQFCKLENVGVTLMLIVMSKFCRGRENN